MEYSNVLAIINGDDGAGVTDLIQVLTGNAYCESGEATPMFREYSEGRIHESKLRVHLYLWFNAWQEGEPQKCFPEVHVEHHAALCRHFRANAAEIRRLPVPQ